MQTRLVRIRSSMDADFPAYLVLFTAYEEEIGLNPAGSREKLLRRVDREGAQDLHALLLAEETPAGYESTGRMDPTDGADIRQNGN